MTVKKYKFMNNKGFTLVEVVVSLAVVGMVSLLILSSVRLLSSYTSRKQQHLVDWIRYQAQMENCLSQEILEDVSDHRIQTTHESSTIYYELYQHMIRRTTHQGGHEPLLMGVSKWNVTLHDTYIHIQVYFENGEQYANNIFIQKLAKK